MDRFAVEELLKLAERWEAVVERRVGTRNDKEYSTDPIVDAAAELRATLVKLTGSEAPLLELLIHCPRCLKQHIDDGEFAVKPHKMHACQFCGLGFAVSKEPSVGVQFFSGWKNSGVKIESTDEPPHLSPGVIPVGMELTARVGDQVRVFKGSRW